METDGTVTGNEAVDIASHILVDHFSMLFGTDFVKPVINTVPEIPEITIEPSVSGMENEIESSTLSTRAKNSLTKNGITTLAALKNMSDDEIGNLSGLGEKTIKEILEFIGR
jgi:DNA-directed RNA polymerase subunit alpha